MTGPILIIDPDDVERHWLSRVLKNKSHHVIEAATSVEGLFRVLDSVPNLILLAEEVPPLQASDLIVVLQRVTGAPVILIGSGGDPEEIAALEDGADFYFRRPLGGDVMLARMRAVLRRSSARATSDHVNASAIATGELTPTERRLLVCLAAQGGRPVPAHRLAAAVWESKSTLGAVKFYIWRLRRKLDPASGLSIDALRGVGYRLKRADDRTIEHTAAV